MIVILTLCLWGLLVYSNAFYNSFHFDDFPYIVYNSSIKDFHNFHNILGIEPTRLVTHLTFALNYHWGGLDVFGYHVVSLLIHVATSILVWQFMLLTLNVPILKTGSSSSRTAWIAFFTAAIFLTHPLQTQAVNYIYQRAVLLAAFFYIASLILFIKAHWAWEVKTVSLKAPLYYSGSLICALLSMLSKENAVSLPFMICFYQWFFFNGPKAIHWKRIFPFFLMILILPLISGYFNLQVLMGLNKAVTGFEQSRMTVHEYAMTQGQVILTYLKLLIVPFHQRVEYDYTAASSFFDARVLGSLFFLLLILGVAALLARKFKLVAFGIFWFFITLIPESSFFPNRDLIFEHRVYLPLLGFGIFLSSGLFELFGTERKSLALRILFVFVIVYSVLTFQRNKVWKNEFTLWDDAVHQSPNSSRAYLNRGAAYQANGDLDHALMDYNTVIGMGPVDAVTLSNRGEIFEQKGAFDTALANYNLAIKINPHYAGTYLNRGLLYKKEGELNLALTDFDKVLEYRPDDVNLYELRAETYFLNKEYDKSWADIRRVQQLGSHDQPLFLEDLKKASGLR